MPSSIDRGTLAQSPVTSPSFKSKRKSFARRCERCCCTCIIYFPLVFVYGLTSWAVWVQACVGIAPSSSRWIGNHILAVQFSLSADWKLNKYRVLGYWSAAIGILFYILLNWSYTTAVFTDPGSPLTQTTSAYSVIPSDDSDDEDVERRLHSRNRNPEPKHTSLTVKSTGEARYCKKCHSRKPDRAHHCSTCRRCVLKMDHHCPWLATCVGFRNYKPFLLFLTYTSLFCWLCFAVTGAWVWNEMLGGTAFGESDRLMPVNNILLAVLSGIIGLVLSGFTGWHIYLACTGQTTIESLEKTRYLAPLRQSMQHDPNDPSRHPITNDFNNSTHAAASPNFASQLRAIHANALPGITRPEEGVSSRPHTPNTNTHPLNPSNNSPAHASLRQNLAHATHPSQHPQNHTIAAEAARERARYAAYLDELDSAKLPNAFDHGWRANLSHVFGPRPLFWALPICNTTGDGWSWQPGARWLEAREKLVREREARAREDAAFARERVETMGPPPQHAQGAGRWWRGPPGQGAHVHSHHAPLEAGRMGGGNGNGSDGDEDEDDLPLSQRRERMQRRPQNWGREGPMASWNDVPDELLAPAGSGRSSRAGTRTPSGRARGSPGNV